ncbi:MAG: hypothetical protein IJV37_06985, partial [Bacteroidales bacterium]|nr:hypothetical protein [Bacteroidales bacterium]
SDLTLREAAAQAGVSYTGLRAYVLFYHRELADARLRQREDAAGRKVARGQRGGNGAHREPKPETVAKYAEALRLVQETELTNVEIAASCGVGEGGLRNYLRVWHPALMQGRTHWEPER